MTVIPLAQSELRRLIEKTRTRDLRPRDASVFYAVLMHLNPNTFTTKVSCALMAEEIGMQRPHFVASVSRLVATGVLARHYDSRTREATLGLPEDLVAHSYRLQARKDDGYDDTSDLVLDPDAMYERDAQRRSFSVVPY